MPTNLANIYGGSPMGGALGLRTCSIYRLDPTGTTALEPVLDIVPGVSPLRVTFDVIDQETFRKDYRVTTNTMQDFSDATSNVYQELAVLSVSGVLAAGGPLALGPAPVGGINVGALVRLDLIRANYLRQIADARQPIMIVTPHHSIARGFIQSLPSSWQVADGKSIPISITVIEARILGPGAITAFADADSMATGNNASQGGGQGGGEVVEDVDFLNPLEL
jgi:hypothetical protein